jgi:hypothetical protein
MDEFRDLNIRGRRSRLYKLFPKCNSIVYEHDNLKELQVFRKHFSGNPNFILNPTCDRYNSAHEELEELKIYDEYLNGDASFFITPIYPQFNWRKFKVEFAFKIRVFRCFW